MGLAIEIVSRLEQTEVGLQWYNINVPTSATNGITFAWTMGLLLIDALLYMLIAWYALTHCITSTVI